MNEQEKIITEQAALIKEYEGRLERYKVELRAVKVELDYVRNPPGFNQFIDKLAVFRDYADELEANNSVKWGRLQAMDNYLMNTF